MISRLTHGFSDRCLRFTNAVADARARLASGRQAVPLPGGCRTRWITMKGFRLHPSPFPGLTLTLAGHTRDASCSSSPRSARRRSRPRRCGGSTSCSRSSASISGKPAEERLAVRKERAKPLVLELEAWLRVQHARVSRKSEIGKAIAYALNHWKALIRFLGDGRICLSNNAAERALRGVAVGQAQLDLRRLRSWRRAGGGHLHPDRDRQAQRR